MKITFVQANNHKRVFTVESPRGRMSLPYERCEPIPTAEDPIVECFIDPELACEGITYRLASGEEGSAVLDQFLDYNDDPEYVRDIMLYKMTLEAQAAVKASRLSKREIARRLGTSQSQLNRILDQTNYSKTMDSVVELLTALDRDVELVVRERPAKTYRSSRKTSE